MSARRQLIAALSEDSMGGIATLQDVDHAEQLVDAYRAEVLAADGQAYDGELAMARGLIRTLRAVVRPDDADMGEVRRLLHHHASDDAAARDEIAKKGTPLAPAPDLHGVILNALGSARGPALPLPAHTQRLLANAVTDAVAPLVPYRAVWDASLPPGGAVCSICGQPVESEPCADHAPDFFQPGRTYAYDASGFTAPELLTLFRVVATTTHPDTGERSAFGWIRTAEDTAWTPYSEPAHEWPACWTDVTDTTQGDSK